MGRVKIGKLTEFPDGEMSGVDVDGRILLVVNLEGRLHAVGSDLADSATRLWHSVLKGDAIESEDGTRRDVRTGRVIYAPRRICGDAWDLTPYRVTIEEDDVVIELM